MQAIKTLTKMLELEGLTLEVLESKLREQDEWSFDSTEDLQNTLNGLVMMKKIKKVGNLFAGNEVEIKERRQTPNNTDRHANSDENIKYPEWVTNDKDRVQFLLSPECPPMLRAKNLTYFDEIISATGREIHDVLTSKVITHEICIAPDVNKNCNYVVFHHTTNLARGFGVTISDGKYRMYITAINGSTEKFFDTYEEMKTWLLKNL